MFLCVCVGILFLGVKGFGAVLHYIESSRAQAIDAMQETFAPIGNTEDPRAYDPAAETYAGESPADDGGTGAAEPETPEETENGISSGGRVIDPTRPMIALTFDDGPAPDIGNALMDELEAVGGRATFFLVGNISTGEKATAELQRMVANGHEVANHSWDHDIHLSKKGREYIRNEFDKADAAIREASGVEPTLIRLPGGNVSDDVRAVIEKPLIYWSIDTLDWKTKDAQSTIDAVLDNAKDGDIVLMHEIWSATGEACKTIIPKLAERGFQLVTVSELIEARGETGNLKLGKQYSNFPPKETEAPAPESSEETAGEAGEAYSGASEGGAEAAAAAVDGETVSAA